MTPKQPNNETSMANLDDFDRQSGGWMERILFNNRRLVICLCVIITLVLGFQATKLQLNAGFEKMIPTTHPYIVNYLKYKGELLGLGNTLRIAVETTEGTILDPAYIETLRQINDEVFLLSGVDRPGMKSLWTPVVRWLAVTEDGLDGGPVMPDDYNGSAESITQLQRNIERSGEVGQLVAPNFKSSVIFVPLLESDPNTGKPLDYREFATNLENLRQKYQSGPIELHITGFAKIVGDLIEGLKQVLMFFALAVTITIGLLYWYTRCWRSTSLVVVCSLVAVIWQLGILATLGYELDPYSILVPFLVFAIGMSHGAQKMNGIMLDIGRGAHCVVASRLTFRRLFLAGLTALLSDAIGFAVLMSIKIQVIQDLAIAASIGVAALIFTNLILVPLLLSFTGVNAKAAARSVKSEKLDTSGNDAANRHLVWRFLDLFTRPKWAAVAIVVSCVMAFGGAVVRRDLKIGDLDPGAPELRAESRYNRDNAFMTDNYSTSSDVLVVIVKTPPYGGTQYEVLRHMDALERELQQLDGVESTTSLAGTSKKIIVGMNEDNLKWYDLLPNQGMLNAIATRAPRHLFNQTVDVLSLNIFLKDHKADTLTRVVNKVEQYAQKANTGDMQFLLAAGSSGIESATNIVVKDSMATMMYWVYGAVILLCFVTFRSWRAVVAAVLPLVVTSVLCETLMVWMGIGVKVATLPVIALGVGLGVDYALYVMAVTLDRLNEGYSLSDAYYHALRFTGKVVVLIGLTLSVSVGTWAFSPIKFQADMGILLAFMCVWNMFGALIFLPALACLLKMGSRQKASAVKSACTVKL